MKVLIFLSFLAAARAGVFTTNYVPAPVAYTRTLTAPVYQSTHESRTKSLDGTQHDTFAKTLNIPNASIKNFDSRTTNNGFVTHTVPVYSNAHTTFNVAAPEVHHVASPVAYTAHSGPYITKTVSPSLTTYASHTPVVAQPAVKITYSEAPLVSHMTFTGLGTSYSW